MPIELTAELGKVFVSNEVIAALAGSAAMECYGLVGMSSRNQLRDGISELLRWDNLSRGVEVIWTNGKLAVHLYIVVGYGTKISEVANNVQSRVKYALNTAAGLQVDEVNITVQGVRVTE
jgi:uncharacterized alkaline shock family protein YloU